MELTGALITCYKGGILREKHSLQMAAMKPATPQGIGGMGPGVD